MPLADHPSVAPQAVCGERQHFSWGGKGIEFNAERPFSPEVAHHPVVCQQSEEAVRGHRVDFVARVESNCASDILTSNGNGVLFVHRAGLSGQDAVPAAYQVNTGALDESAVAPNTLLQVNGSVTPFGSAPPDFTASAITPGAATQQTLVVEWANGGSATPFSSASSAGFVVNLADPNLSIHHIRTGPIASGPGVLDLTSLPQSPLITTTGADPNNLDLAVGSATLATTGVSVFNTATTFATGVTAHLNGTNKIFRLVAYGQYDSGTNTFVASRIHVALHE